MPFDADQLYQLLPTIYRLRDNDDNALKALVTILAEQAGIVDDDIARLYDNWFIETCDEWLVPYIGDLLAARGLHSLRETSARTNTFSQRARVANTIRYRRRKGTAAMLEQLARDVTGWDARVVEFFQLITTTQNINHLRPTNLYTVDLHDRVALEALNTPFDTIAHTGEVRHIDNRRGKYNIPNIGIFLWRLQAYPLTESPAIELKGTDGCRFFFSPLGCNTQLFTHPITESEITHLAQPINVPEKISHLRLEKGLNDYYGEGRSIVVKDGDAHLIASDQIVICDLSDTTDKSDWMNTPEANKVAIDPVLGRLRFGIKPANTPYVTFHYGFSADIGGGEYDREKFIDANLLPIRQNVGEILQDVLNRVGSVGGAVEIPDSGRCSLPGLSMILTNGHRVEVRSANERRATIVLSNDLASPQNFVITGDGKNELILNGLLIIGGALEVRGIAKLTLKHCTLVPGLALDAAGAARHNNKPSLIVETGTTIIEIDHSITGALQLSNGVNLTIRDSIVQGLESPAISAANRVTIERSTIFGAVNIKQLDLASESIFTKSITVERRQEGCVRFSHVPNDSKTPRRYHCQPDLAIKGVMDTDQNDICLRLAPSFTSQKYGEAAYAQLSPFCAEEITTGAEDGSEMGAFSFLKQSQRLANLHADLDEYLRFGLEAGIFFAS